ncbi:hypothetical protein QCA50_002832 [Cerrena zonata]|uniref:Uncharacterized protein n=1 Tax=Cerrena zonata TaxID=2478898 RepID=A0AAW0GV41_9APHY
MNKWRPLGYTTTATGATFKLSQLADSLGTIRSVSKPPDDVRQGLTRNIHHIPYWKAWSLDSLKRSRDGSGDVETSITMVLGAWLGYSSVPQPLSDIPLEKKRSLGHL